MAQQDYVKRGRAPQKKNNSKQAKQAQSEVGVSPWAWMRLAGIAALLIGFGTFLWSIKDASKTQPDATTQEKKIVKEDELPTLDKEEWGYISGLLDYEVEVELPEEQVKPHKFVMQCASVRTRNQAESLKARIAFQGLASEISATKGKNGDWFRVVMGPYKSKRKAESQKHVLQKAGINDCLIYKILDR